jgi:hypothetical protein
VEQKKVEQKNITLKKWKKKILAKIASLLNLFN